MTANDGTPAAIEQAHRRAEMELERAAKVAELAARHESRLTEPRVRSTMADFHANMAAAHRRTEERHLVAARIHRAHAQRLEAWARRGAITTPQPGFMDAVAATAGSQCATLILLGSGNSEAFVAASDATSQAAHDLELTFAEGPTREAMLQSTPVVATGNEMSVRWPNCGPELQDLGVQTVAAVGLRAPPAGCLGSLAVYDPSPPVLATTGKYRLASIASAVVDSVLLAPDAVNSNDGLPSLSLFEDESFQPVLHQAAGRIHGASGCGIDTALTLIRAHALAESRSVADVASDVVDGALTLP